MADRLDRYQFKLSEAEGVLQQVLLSPSPDKGIPAYDSKDNDAYTIAVFRKMLDFMVADLRDRPQETMKYWDFAAQKTPGRDGPFIWCEDTKNRAVRFIDGYTPNSTEIGRKLREYTQAYKAEIKNLNVRDHTIDSCDALYLVEANENVDRAITLLKEALHRYLENRWNDESFYRESSHAMLINVMQLRQDVVTYIRASQPRGLGSITAFPIDENVAQGAFEMVFSLIPVFGNGMALMEATTGRDLFCRKLGTAERVIAAVSVILPPLAKLAKLGKAACSAERMVALYGGDALRWAGFLGGAERLSANTAEQAALREAGDAVRSGGSISASTARDANAGLEKLVGKGFAKASISTASAKTSLLDTLRQAASGKPLLAELDEPALDRIVQKARTKSGFSVEQAKGQMLEEFAQARTERLLQQKYAHLALGIDAPSISPPVFIPGHLTSDAAKRALGDGSVGYMLPKSSITLAEFGPRTPDEIKRIRGAFDLKVMFEAKAGEAAAEKLAYNYEVTRADLEVIADLAAKRFASLQATAAKTGIPTTTTLDEVTAAVRKDFKLGEFGGQVRMTIERLDANADGSLTKIFVGDDEYLVRTPGISKLKIFGVVPRDVPIAVRTRIVNILRSPVIKGGQGLNFELLGMDVTQDELKRMVAAILKAAGAK